MDNTSLVINSSKGILAMVTGLLAYMKGSITELVIALGVIMLLDLATGMLAGYITKQWDSSLGKRGFFKKIGFVFLFMVAVLADYVLLHVGVKIGIVMPFAGIFTFAITCWLISTEALSIIENLGRMGVRIPKFLKIAFVKLKEVSESTGSQAAESIKKGDVK